MIGEVHILDRSTPPLHFLIRIESHVLWEIGGRRMVGGSDRPCHGHLARRTHLARHDVGNTVSALFSRLPCHDDCIGTVAPRHCLYHRAGIDDHYHRLACLTEHIAHTVDELALQRSDVELLLN